MRPSQVKHQETKVKKSQTTQKHNTKTSKTKKRGGNTTFFSSGMADVALWLGSYMSISGQKRRLYKDPEGPEVQANHNKTKTTQNNKTTRKSPARMRSSKQKQQTRHTKGQEPNKTPTKKICQGTQYSKTCKINYPPRHLVKPR